MKTYGMINLIMFIWYLCNTYLKTHVTMFAVVLYCHLNHQTTHEQACNPYRRFAGSNLSAGSKGAVARAGATEG